MRRKDHFQECIKYDYLAPRQSAKDYLELISAPEKEFIVFDKSAHYPQFEEKQEFYKLVNQIYNQVSLK